MNKKIKIIFTLSITLNMLFIGILIGHFSHRLTMRYDMMSTLNSLPSEKKELALNTMNELREQTRGSKETIKKERKEILEVLKAPEFNPDSFDSKIGKLNRSFNELTLDISEAVKKLALNLNQQERIKLVELIEKGHKTHRFRTRWEDNWTLHETNGGNQ